MRNCFAIPQSLEKSKEGFFQGRFRERYFFFAIEIELEKFKFLVKIGKKYAKFLIMCYNFFIMKRVRSFFGSLVAEVKAMRPLTWVMLLITLALYFITVPYTTHFAHSRAMVTVLNGRIPLSAFAGVLSSISNIVLIFLVVFFGKLGFCTCMGITVVRFIRLAQGIFIRHNIPSLPGTFIALTSIINPW